MEEKVNGSLKEDRLITPEERLWLIQTVINAKGLHGLLTEVESKFSKTSVLGLQEPMSKVNTSPQDEANQKTNVKDETYDHVEKSGMYEKDSLHLVAAEFGSNISKEGQASREIEVPKQEKPVQVNEAIQTPEEINMDVPQIEEPVSKPITRVREPQRSNPWGESRTVSPGEIKL